ncbi:unnamed protein product [Schistosoma turkestanicum]|nr:unnamed protein product [Schistosoma turkestanicum]
MISSNLHEIIQSQTTSQITSTSSHRIDPCDNFYQYACKEWEANNPIPDNEGQITTFMKAGKTIDDYFYNMIANNSYVSTDQRLIAAQNFYKACIKNPFDSDDQVKNQLLQLISMSFGQWDLLPAFSGSRANTNQVMRNVVNLNLTEIYLPLISTTGYSPLFSMDVDADTNLIRIYPGRLSSNLNYLNEYGFPYLKDKFYEAVDLLNINHSNDDSLNGTFELFDQLANNYLGAGTFSTSGSRKVVRLEELKDICRQIDWDYLFDKVFNETGISDYKSRQIEIVDTFLLQYSCGLHQIQLETVEGKSALYNLAILNFVVEQLSHSLHRDRFIRGNRTNPGTTIYFLPYCINRYSRTQVQQLVSELRDTIAQSITQATWLDSETKLFAKEKVRNIIPFVLYSDVNEPERRANLSAINRYSINSLDHILNEYYV